MSAVLDAPARGAAPPPAAAPAPARAGRPPRRSGRGGGAERVLGVVWLLGAVAVAVVLAWPVWATPRLALVAAAGTLVGAGVVLLGAARRWGPLRRAVLVAAGFLVVAVPVAVPWRADLRGWPAGLVEAVAAVVVGWKQLLTLELPVEEYQAVLVPFLVAVVVTAAVAAPLAVRRDTRAVLAVPVLAVLALVGPAFGPVAPQPALDLGPVRVPDARTTLGLAALVLWSVLWAVARAAVARRRAVRVGSGGQARRRRRGVATTLGRLVAALVLVGVAVGAAAWVAPGTPGWAQRHVLREDVEPVLAVQHEPSPLTSYRAAFRTDAFGEELFTVAVDGSGVDRLRTAVLDTYDGASFRVGTEGPAGRFLRLPRSSTAGATAQVEVVVGDAWSGIWVPVPSGVVAAPRFAGLRADALAASFYLGPDDGSAVTVADGGPEGRGLAPGDSYRVAAAPRATGPEMLGAPGEVDAEALAEQLPQLTEWVESQQVGRDADALVTLVERLRARSYLSHSVADDAAADAWISALQAQGDYVFQSSYAGHSRARVEELFAELLEQEEALGAGADDAALVAAIGDDEQLATAAALVARHLGYESRVVMGVRLEDVPGATVPACTDVCTGANLAAWVEVRSPGGDWVTLDVDPQVDNPPVRVEQGTQAPQNPTTVQPPELPVVDPPVLSRDGAGDDQDSRDEEARFGDSPWLAVLRTVGLVAGGLALLVAPLLVLPVAKAVRRRRRRHAAVPEVAVVGAWAELVDRSTDLGRPLEGPTRAAAAAASGRDGAVQLAALVDRAVFAAVPPGPDDAAAAWEASDAEAAALAQEHPPWRRVGAALSGASLVRALAPGRRRASDAVAPEEE